MTGTPVTEERWAEGVRQHLKPLRAPLLAELRRLLAMPLGTDEKTGDTIAVLAFEVFVDGFTDRFPVVAYPVDAGNSQLDWPVVGGACALLEGHITYPDSFEDAARAAGQIDFDLWSVSANDALIPWFADVWTEAGGASFGIPATIGVHDGAEEFNLQTGEWQDTDSLYQ